MRLCCSLVHCCGTQKYPPAISQTFVNFADALKQLGGDAWLRMIPPPCQKNCASLHENTLALPCCHQISLLGFELKCNVISSGQKIGPQDDNLYS